MRLKLTIAYDGRPYQGWQTQVGGNTIQDFLENALHEVAKEKVRLHASGRTDTGVHALGQVAHFDAPEAIQMNPFNWVPALNCRLPASIRVMACEEAPIDFHSRFSSVGKTYYYDICTLPILPPFKAGLAWHLPRLLDPDALGEALHHMIGTHDFHGFAAYRGNEQADHDWVRTIRRSAFAAGDEGYRITLEGNGFFYKMVRLLVGGAVQVAQGKLAIDRFAQYFDQPDGLPFGKSPVCAPADGLYLESVCYA